MRTVLRVLAFQAALAAAALAVYASVVGFDRTVHQAMLFGTAARTIVMPRGKTAESDRMVVTVGRARLASEVYGSWVGVPAIEIVDEAVLGAERYVAFYVCPHDGEVKRFDTVVRWQVMGERYPFIEED